MGGLSVSQGPDNRQNNINTLSWAPYAADGGSFIEGYGVDGYCCENDLTGISGSG